jgi:hypothetical protein
MPLSEWAGARFNGAKSKASKPIRNAAWASTLINCMAVKEIPPCKFRFSTSTPSIRKASKPIQVPDSNQWNTMSRTTPVKATNFRKAIWDLREVLTCWVLVLLLMISPFKLLIFLPYKLRAT